MKKINMLHPVVVFIFSLVALGVSLYLYIDSYIEVNETFQAFVKQSGLPQGRFKSPETWVMILVLSLLVALIVIGMSLVFIYYQKVIMLYRMQQNFINGFTHELKTPIASLKIFIDTFTSHDLSREKQLEVLELMKRDTDRMQENVEQILNLGKIEDRNFKPSLKEIEIREALEEFLKKHSHLFTGGEIQLGSLETKCWVQFDQKLLEIVFMNLLVNAFCYNRSEKKKVEIYFKDHGNKVEITFKDNGQGLSREHLKNIFKKFYQIGKSVKGTGLGLYMVSQIIRLHRARVWATSEGRDRGSSFHILLNKVGVSGE